MSIIQMTVTDEYGRIAAGETSLAGTYSFIKKSEPSLSDEDDPYRFYASQSVNPSDIQTSSLPESLKPNIITMVLPLGGTESGLFRFPQIGDKVLVAVEESGNYLMGYLPGGDVPFNRKIRIEKEVRTETAGTQTVAVETEDARTLLEQRGLVMRYRKTGGNKSLGIQDSEYSEIAVCSEPTPWPTRDSENIHVRTIEDKSYPVIDRIKIDSTGDILSRAENFNQLRGQRVLLHSKYLTEKNLDAEKDLKERRIELSEIDRGDICIDADHRIVLNAREGILFQVGPAQISLTPSGIEISCRKLDGEAKGNGPFDAMISLSDAAGVRMTGKQLLGKFNRSCSVSDAFGGGISCSLGRLNLFGSGVSMKAGTTLNSIFSMIDGIGKMISQIASVPFSASKNNPGLQSDFSGEEFSQQLEMVMDLASQVGDGFTQSAGAGPAGSKDIVGMILDIIGAVIDNVRTVVERDYFNRYAVHYDTETGLFSSEDKRFDCFLGFTIAETVFQIGVLTNMVIRARKALLHEASLSLSPNAEVILDSKSFYQDSVDEKNARGPMSGVNIVAEDNTLSKQDADAAATAAEQDESAKKTAFEQAQDEENRAKTEAEEKRKDAEEARKRAESDPTPANQKAAADAEMAAAEAEKTAQTAAKEKEQARADYEQAQKNTQTAKDNQKAAEARDKENKKNTAEAAKNQAAADEADLKDKRQAYEDAQSEYDAAQQKTRDAEAEKAQRDADPNATAAQKADAAKAVEDARRDEAAAKTERDAKAAENPTDNQLHDAEQAAKDRESEYRQAQKDYIDALKKDVSWKDDPSKAEKYKKFIGKAAPYAALLTKDALTEMGLYLKFVDEELDEKTRQMLKEL